MWRGEVAKNTGLRKREVEGTPPIDQQAHGLVIATSAIAIGGAPGGLGVRNIRAELVAKHCRSEPEAESPEPANGTMKSASMLVKHAVLTSFSSLTGLGTVQ